MWRNEVPEILRTPYPLTQEMQEEFYHKVVCSRNTSSRWWSVYDDKLIGFAGLVNIEWENSLAEISLIMSPWQDAVGLILDEGFGNLGLATIYGECYECSPTLDFWRGMVKKYNGYQTILPRRKRWEGRLWDSLYFSFERTGEHEKRQG